ncbi:helix-turn-helix transcriptional regulator [Zobellella taiwanensis]|uniref:Transcriptional regulator n=1 Tax=Zobellella taiwanensis TaxID=347535 RepID=A0A2P7RDS3_9GAMM|nr:helix-turn-helix transcriptional regulator [Zobellella taiwanensis]PSJ48376.1 transcriptional regulator [Zobellella taiwanensis]
MNKPSPAEREALLISLLTRLFDGTITEGELLRTLRKDLLNMSQTEYASLVGVSRRTLSDIERNVGSPTLAVVNAVFKPFGLKAGLLPRSPTLMKKMLQQ